MFSFSARLNCVLVMLDRYNRSNWSCKNRQIENTSISFFCYNVWFSFLALSFTIFFTWRLSLTRLSKTCGGNLGREATASAMNRPMLLSGVV